GDPGDLEGRVGDADVWVETASRAGDGIDRDGEGWRQSVLQTEFPGKLPDARERLVHGRGRGVVACSVAKLGVRRAEVRTAPCQGIVATAGRGWPRVKVTRPFAALPDQSRTDNLTVAADDQAAPRLFRKEQVSRAGQGDGKNEARHDGQEGNAEQRGTQLLAPAGTSQWIGSRIGRVGRGRRESEWLARAIDFARGFVAHVSLSFLAS